ncbi:MAG: SIS domain-containing protein [Phycisphaerae bacterium]
MKDQIEQHQRAVAAALADIGLLQRIADRVIERFDDGGKLYILGNGGSAADAQHIAAELVGRFKRDRRPLPAVALTTDTSILTAVSNDLGYERCFARQVEAFVTGKDCVWALSVSGRSANILAAVSAAAHIGAFRIGFTGRDGQALKELCDECFQADHTASDRVQEVHQLAYHLICDRIEAHYGT